MQTTKLATPCAPVEVAKERVRGSKEVELVVAGFTGGQV